MATYNEGISYNDPVGYESSVAEIEVLPTLVTATLVFQPPVVNTNGNITIEANTMRASVTAFTPGVLVPKIIVVSTTAQATITANSFFMGISNDTIIHSGLEKELWIYQPNFTRQRHRYRGPRESEKINQEISQVYYDIRRIDGKAIFIQNQMTNNLLHILEGRPVSSILYSWSTDEVIGEQDMYIVGIDDITSRVTTLTERVRHLEQ